MAASLLFRILGRMQLLAEQELPVVAEPVQQQSRKAVSSSGETDFRSPPETPSARCHGAEMGTSCSGGAAIWAP
eukprot:CAMPEP_0178988140 /NCGR_PEP_ID=MMETSP0795-20121207/3651_1 /TAXON_ID=88552 /ORGANISM="Amoebophrya sp., Strain Ameob2" /LENGTH=73 /DNA_ID=CAMNT_0020679393 /DNA_START=957 /DNA_END=1182 /DNA_ORIENTATION=+